VVTSRLKQEFSRGTTLTLVIIQPLAALKEGFLYQGKYAASEMIQGTEARDQSPLVVWLAWLRLLNE